MNRKALTALLTALAVPAVPVLVVACSANASFGGGAQQPTAAPPPPPPPPPPAPTAVATPAATTTPAPAPTPTTAPAEPTPSSAVLKGNSVNIPGNVEFDTGTANLKQGSESEKVLEQLRLFLVENARVTKLRIEGHTDNAGAAAANEKLSGERALTVKRWLVDKGIAKDRLLAVAFGQSKPIADNSAEEGRAKNRRTEFKLAELGGKKYLGMDPAGGGKIFDY